PPTTVVYTLPLHDALPIYLEAHDWRPARRLSRSRWMGLCPLHNDHKPSFLVDPGKSLFYCYGCGRGGDVIRFAELYHQVKFPQRSEEHTSELQSRFDLVCR